MQLTSIQSSCHFSQARKKTSPTCQVVILSHMRDSASHTTPPIFSFHPNPTAQTMRDLFSSNAHSGNNNKNIKNWKKNMEPSLSTGGWTESLSLWASAWNERMEAWTSDFLRLLSSRQIFDRKLQGYRVGWHKGWCDLRCHTVKEEGDVQVEWERKKGGKSVDCKKENSCGGICWRLQTGGIVRRLQHTLPNAWDRNTSLYCWL